MKIKNRIALHLKAKGMQQKELSKLIGIGTVAINRWCTNKRNPEKSLHPKLAEILGVEVKDLFYLDTDEQTSTSDSRQNTGSEGGSTK